MSDTDDTDLLLLIPPDFYLIHSPDPNEVNSDYENDFDIDTNEIKNLIVSDLINQVNDLEGRICMIESLDRSITLHSTCNKDSFANQSINSLTESDVLRYHIPGKPKLSTDELMFNSVTVDSEDNKATFLKFKGSKTEKSSNEVSSERDQLVDLVVHKTDVKNNGEPNSTTEQETVGVEVECYASDVKLNKKSQEELLIEVDSFLDKKKKHILTSDILDEKILDQTQSKSIVHQKSDEFFDLEQNSSYELECQQPEQSLPLPRLYELLKEMEETQHEIERKFKGHQFSSNVQVQENTEISNLPVVNNTKIGSLNTLELEDLYVKPLKSGANYPVHNLDKSKHFQEIKHKIMDKTHQSTMNPSTQINYMFKPSSPSTNVERRTYDRDPLKKSLSPHRIPGQLNPIDVVRANLPRNDNKSFVPLEGNKYSPRIFPGFRRQLNFEKLDFPPRLPKSKSSTSVDWDKINQSDIQYGDKLPPNLMHRTNGTLKTNNEVIDNQFKHITLQTESEGVDTNVTNSKANDITSKVSSNNLLSLSELWNKEPTFYSDDPNKLRQKLEEEKYRRQHCEQEIQMLQLRVLEEQEKLAVAIRVDQEKDKAIIQITESWRKLNDHWGELEDQRHNLAQQLQEERELAKVKSNELTKKNERWEKEVSQALDLAAGYKEKSETVQRQMESLMRDSEEKIGEIRTELENLNQENKKISDENTYLLKQLESFQERLKEEEDLLSKLKNELEKSKKQISDNEAEIFVIKEQKETLSLMLKEERNRNNMLEQQKIAFQQALNDAAKKEKAAEEEARMSSERLEVARTELKAFYQGQLESVVKEKLQEFQSQLEAAETALKAELQLKEQQWIEKANEQCKQLKDKFKKDLQLVEESRREEANKWKFKFMESERLRNIVENKLQEETNRRADIAQRLHSVMETQWREALNIISNPLQNIHEVSKNEERGRQTHSQQGSEREKVGAWSNSTTSLAQAEDAPFCKEGVVTYRPSQPIQDTHLKKYIEMLLERGPGNPVPHHDSMQDSFDQTFPPENSPPSLNWFMEHTKKQPGNADRFGQPCKPPWK